MEASRVFKKYSDIDDSIQRTAQDLTEAKGGRAVAKISCVVRPSSPPATPRKWYLPPVTGLLMLKERSQVAISVVTSRSNPR